MTLLVVIKLVDIHYLEVFYDTYNYYLQKNKFVNNLFTRLCILCSLDIRLTNIGQLKDDISN